MRKIYIQKLYIKDRHSNIKEEEEYLNDSLKHFENIEIIKLDRSQNNNDIACGRITYRIYYYKGQ